MMEAKRVVERGCRNATALDNGLVRVLVDDEGGMVPELSAPRSAGRLNAHWVPEFRSCMPRRDPRSARDYEKSNLMDFIAGNFPCAPVFGSAELVDGASLPAHGWTAHGLWDFKGCGSDGQAAWSWSALKSPDPRFPLSWKKLDALQTGSPVHYTSLEISNSGDRDLEINAAWHNTVGSAFLAPGCRISASASRFSAPPPGSEFDGTGRLERGVEFESLSAAPLREGGTADLSVVPGPIGYTDFVAGAIPEDAPLGWSSVVNPALGFAYACFFPGPAALGGEDLRLSFNGFWMQYGGRRFRPWAAYDGGTDSAFCLGTENLTAAFGNGLAYSRRVRTLLGAPTTAAIPAGGKRTLRYGTLFAPYAAGRLDGGIAALEAAGSTLEASGSAGRTVFEADAGFGLLRELEAAWTRRAR